MEGMAKKKKQRPQATTPPPPQSIAARMSQTQAEGEANRTANNSPGLIVVAALAASVFLFWYYHGMVLNQMADLSNGITMPDQLMLGYGTDHVEALRAAMNSDAVGQLTYVHKTAGLMFPLFFALASLLAIGLSVPRGLLRWGLWIVPMAFTVLDLWENNAIDALFTGALDPGAVALASTLTIIRWVLLFLSFGAVCGALIYSFVKTFRQKWDDAGLRPLR
ncbi:hypothetical protein GCM10027027_03160 [Neomicrococcus lactis]